MFEYQSNQESPRHLEAGPHAGMATMMAKKNTSILIRPTEDDWRELRPRPEPGQLSSGSGDVGPRPEPGKKLVMRFFFFF